MINQLRVDDTGVAEQFTISHTVTGENITAWSQWERDESGALVLRFYAERNDQE